jgi:ATP-dependent RNA helicase RhlE
MKQVLLLKISTISELKYSTFVGIHIKISMTFKELGIIEPILKSLQAQGYSNPTPIQEQSIPILLNRKDLLGCAQTGTGKTAAFSIPIVQLLSLEADNEKGRKKIKALIVTPTRELALQIGDNFKNYSSNTNIRNTVIFGGVKQGAQTNTLRQGVDVLVATPGRLLDLISQGFITLKDIKYFVLDEADQMLDMGFIHDIKKIIAKLPKDRQSLFFSATMPKSIIELSRTILGDYDKVTIKPQQATAEKVEQEIYFVSKPSKPKLLNHLIANELKGSILVFSRTKHGCDKIVRILEKANIGAKAIHGNKSQNNRVKALNDFKTGKINVLVATDIAARGIDVENLAFVINFDLPNVPETYVHRIGRTGRASASGKAISFCNFEEKPYLKDIQKLIKQQIPIMDDHPFPDDGSEDVPSAKPQQRRSKPKKQWSNNKDGGGNRRNSGSSKRKNFN